MKEFEIKGNRQVLVDLEVGEYSDSNNRITAYAQEDLHQVGYLNFKVKGRSADIWSFKVDDPQYLRTGVGNIMLNCFEEYCRDNRVQCIEGRFYPDGEGAVYSREFYESHGYSIYRDGYEQYLIKRLEPVETKSPVDYTLIPNNQDLNQ